MVDTLNALAQLELEDAVDVLRVICPDTQLCVLRQMAAMIVIWHADIWWTGLQRPEGRGLAGIGWMKIGLN